MPEMQLDIGKYLICCLVTENKCFLPAYACTCYVAVTKAQFIYFFKMTKGGEENSYDQIVAFAWRSHLGIFVFHFMSRVDLDLDLRKT